VKSATASTSAPLVETTAGAGAGAGGFTNTGRTDEQWSHGEGLAKHPANARHAFPAQIVCARDPTLVITAIWDIRIVMANVRWARKRPTKSLAHQRRCQHGLGGLEPQTIRWVNGSEGGRLAGSCGCWVVGGCSLCAQLQGTMPAYFPCRDHRSTTTAAGCCHPGRRLARRRHRSVGLPAACWIMCSGCRHSLLNQQRQLVLKDYTSSHRRVA
jgi:hypothetical protein